MVKVEDDDDGLLMTPQLKEKLRKKKKMAGDYSLDVEDPKELGIVYPTPILDYVISPMLLNSRHKKRDLIVDHKNDALSCKFDLCI